MSEDMRELRKLGKPELAVSLANMVRECMLPEDGKWTIAAGRDCIDTLLLAARMVFPTQADIDSVVSRALSSDVKVSCDTKLDIREVAQDVAAELEKSREHDA